MLAPMCIIWGETPQLFVKENMMKSAKTSKRTSISGVKSAGTDPINLPDLLSNIADVKYPCTKRAIAISKEAPQDLYADFDFFVELLDNKNRLLKWTAIRVLGNLSQDDPENKIRKVIPEFYRYLKGPEMITASNTIKTLGMVARSKPEYRIEIMKELLKVEDAEYYNKGELSPECLNIAIGNVIEVYGQFPAELASHEPMVKFVERQLENTRPSVVKRAEKVMKKI
jgi:hypothetical protein